MHKAMFCLFHLLRVKTLKLKNCNSLFSFKLCTCSITLAVCDFVTVVPRKSASYRLPIGFTLSCSYGENLAPAPAGFATRNPANPAGF